MPAYLIAQLRIHDKEAYGKYGSAVDGTLTSYDGKILSVEESPKILEGEWSHTRSVLIEFPSIEMATAWYSSPEYQAIVGQRLSAASGNLVVMKGR